ncbi:MAG: leucine--tRNA ligase [Lentisphaerae bacterium]|jgi:leucyl-tRNA synthetase|nr:leucine--tRNA ligase [Lentisphaerota bacterium]
MAYPHADIEARWQAYWEKHKTFRTPDEVDPTREKFYVLDMFPYPSGDGLHVGHPEGYTATDILARYQRMKGVNVLHPMGWDSFGLPAEQHAINTGNHPKGKTYENIDTFRRQLKMLGFSYDWDREIATTDDEYVRWTQWIFLQLFKRGLAYEGEMPVNWSPDLCAVLANEEVEEQRAKGYRVERRAMRQWVLKITAYAERLLADLDDLDWPESIKEMQRNWIGRSEGAEVDFAVNGETLRVYTTRPDTLFGATYMVLAPEHPLVDRITTPEQRAEVEAYRTAAAAKSDLERAELTKEKTGVFTGGFAVNPVNGESIPVWIADYVLWGYGTGAIMAVPAHDTRDYEFAEKFGLPIIQVVEPPEGVDWRGYVDDGVAVNSGEYDGLPTEEFKQRITAWLEERGVGEAKVNYKLRDWLFSRQRFWGEPFPLLHCPKCGVVPVPEDELPVRLPEMSDYRPTPDGQPPLARAEEWVKAVCPKCGGPATRETNTMPQWAGSCWYYLRFIDPRNDRALVDPEKEKYWMPVDLYVGGAEHAVLHLLYSRFWHKVLYDCGVVSMAEPFRKLVNQGMILGEMEYTLFRDAATGEPVSYDQTTANGQYEQVRLTEAEVDKAGDGFVWKAQREIVVKARADKMSKSRGNVINPDHIVKEYGADSLRLYEMFMGPLTQVKPWSMKGVEGVFRFLNRVYRLVVVEETGELSPRLSDETPTPEQLHALHVAIQKVTEDIEQMDFNTAISAMMIFVNAAQGWERLPKKLLEPFVLILSPFAPHLAEELWHRLGHEETLAYEPWPAVNPEYLKRETIEIPIQVNGRLRGRVQLAPDSPEAEVLAAALACPEVQAHLAGKELKRKIYIPGRMVNLVVG